MCLDCDYATCIASGVPCRHECHDDIDLKYMARYAAERRKERCVDCRFAPIACGKGLCYCECHGDRPRVPNPEHVVAPGHDEQGHERSFAHLSVSDPVEPDLDRLIELRTMYARETHPEWTVGGAR